MTPVLLGGSYKCQCGSSYQLVASERLNASTCVKLSHVGVLSAKVVLSSAATATSVDFDAADTGSSGTTLTFVSALYQDVFLLAASECYFYRSELQNRFCQVLGNVCVLQHFSAAASSCALLDLIQRSGRTTVANSVSGWYTTLPFLSYDANMKSVLESTMIGMAMSFDEVAASATSDHLEFVLVSYDFSGSITSARRLTDELLYCLSDTSVGTPLWARFGASMSQQYACDLGALDAARLALYELFLVDRSKSEGDAERLVPVPVQNLNYRDAKGFAVNENTHQSDASDDFLSHRFFLYDFQSGVAAGESKPTVYRYAKSITLTIRTRSADVQRLYPPLLSISYADTQTLRSATLQFHVTYASDSSGFWATATALFVVACALAACRVVLQTYTWQRRSTRNEEMEAALWHSMAHLLTCSASNAARASFAVLLAVSAYFLLFFKLQSSVYVLLPETNDQALATAMDEYHAFRVLLPLCFALQLAFVLHTVYSQTHVQVFFIDWEKPRARAVDGDAAGPQSAPPVSVWRTILAVNEWKALQVARRSSFELTVVLLLFLLYGCDLRAAAIPIPQAQLAHAGALAGADANRARNPYLRFATVSGSWLLLCLAQRGWKWLVYDRFVDEPRESLFIDLCTVAKVSCLVLDEPYHGFYLHCRSPYPFADGNMSELVAQLKQEAAGLTVGRGLDRSLPDCQAFELFVTRKWKRKFQALAAAVHPAASRPTGLKSGPELVRRHRPFALERRGAESAVTQAMVKHASNLSDFVKAFVENQEEQYRWRIYRAQTWLGSLLGIPPEITSSKQSLFLPDTSSKFATVLFLGIETDLMLLNITCFGVVDLWTDNHAVSALVTYLLERGLVTLRSHYGSKRLARNTLVDPRFLL
ncbi:hypothetical protein PybrP1_000064 [[Pythium] brassicae (nom. inval.)]|nr:hypothetical protein PybrP1_000064 [[Pythium] brassicae (nom. inval.)]